jgi:hypothetical protein
VVPSVNPSALPSESPSKIASAQPSISPDPSGNPSAGPSADPSALASDAPSGNPTLSRSTALGNVIGSYYNAEGSFDFVEGSNQHAALKLLADSDPDLVPIPDDSDDGQYLLLQRYVVILVSLFTNVDMEDEASSMTTCKWFAVTCYDGIKIDILSRTYCTVKTEPIICHMIFHSLLFCFQKVSSGAYEGGSGEDPGSLPTEIGFLTSIKELLFSSLCGSMLTGTIPSQIGYLSNLVVLDLSEWASINRVKKNSHPVRLSHTFLVLLDSCRMTGGHELTGPIPVELGGLGALDQLMLCEWASVNGVKKDSHPVRLSHTFLVLLDSSRMTAANKLTGPIPWYDFNDFSNLVVLDLREWASIK